VPDQNLRNTDVFLKAPLPENGPQTISSLVEVDLAGHSDPGKLRANNEDTFFIARFDRNMRALQSNLPGGSYPEFCSESSYGMLVADGMGGHAAGEQASRTAILVLLDLVLRTPDWIMRLDDDLVAEVRRRIEQRLQQVQGTLAEQARSDPNLRGMGTTLTLAWSLGADLIVAHVGDSRAYLMRQGELRQLTHDQTFAQAMVEAGTLTAEQAAHHRLRHLLTGVLTTSKNPMPVEFHRVTLEDGDQVLLCSDGLTEMAPPSAIADVLRQSGSAADTCRDLVALALDAGGKDNVTAIVARYRFPGTTFR
jgi:protein phosphatase